MRPVVQRFSLLVLLVAATSCMPHVALDRPHPETTVQVWNQSLVDMTPDTRSR